MVLKGSFRKKSSAEQRSRAQSTERVRIQNILASTGAGKKLRNLVANLTRQMQGHGVNGAISVTLDVQSFDHEGLPLAKESIPTHAAFH